MGGVSAAVAKTSAAPIERIKLLVQNQDEMVRLIVAARFVLVLIHSILRSNKVVWLHPTRVWAMLSPAHTVKRALFRSGEETPPTSFGTSPPRLSTLPSVRLSFNFYDFY